MPEYLLKVKSRNTNDVGSWSGNKSQSKDMSGVQNESIRESMEGRNKKATALSKDF